MYNMPSNGEIVRTDNAARLISIEKDAPEHPPAAEIGVNPTRVIFELLRGRYHWVIPLAIICGLICGLTCRQMVKDTYSSTGTLRIRPTLPRVLVENEENGQLPMYQAFVDMQATLLTSEKVLDLAVQDPAWEALVGPASPDTAGRMLGNLKVTAEGELITVSYTDRNPNLTAIAVRAAISAYIQLYSETDEASKESHIKLLENVKNTDAARLASLNHECLDIAAKYGSTNLDALVELKMQELSELKAAARQIELSMAAVQSNAATSNAPSTPVSAVTPEVWAFSDREMASLLDQKRQAEMRLRTNQQVLGANSPTLHTDELNLQMVKDAIQERADFLAKNFPQGGAAAAAGSATSLASLQSQKQMLDADTAKANTELADLGKSNVRLKEINNQQTTLQQQLTETGQSLEELKVENATNGRIDVLSYGDRPQLQTSRRSLMTAAGGSVGALGAVGCVVLLELRHRRVRHASDVQRGGSSYGNLAFLGAVPLILEDHPDIDHDAVAYAVHKIRARLETGAAQRDQRILAVTSPAPGNGKTSLVMALGISFAGSGSRTLLIDADIIAGGLSTRLNVKIRQNVAEIIRRNTDVSEQQLAHASEVSRSERSSLIQKLLDFDFLDHESAVRVSNLHKESSIGILDALAGDNLNDCVASTSWPNLFVLPRGAAMNGHSGYLSPTAFRRLLQQARAAFDVVLVDTGPILGSIEATVATAAADGTVLVVSRGGSADEIRRAAGELDATGANVLGVIFNRAKTEDLLVSGSSTGYRSQPHPSNGNSVAAAGPIANAMVQTSPPANGQSHR